MESPQSVVSPFNHEIQNLDLFTKSPTFTPKKPEPESFLGVLDVHIHQARDIQNICIYHKQDVYAKICITTNPEKSVTTQTINGGGKNPVFNETLRINVPTIDSSLKCEIYMLSRVRNYLEDQLLGFTLIPLSEIVTKNTKFEKEFTLSSTDLFHSPSGFVHLALSYTGVSPDIIVIPPPPTAAGTTTGTTTGAANDSELTEFEKIEFPDPKIANENDMMVTEYFGLSPECTDHQIDPQIEEIVETLKADSPNTSVSTNGSHCHVTTTESYPKSPNQEHDSPLNEKSAKSNDHEADSVGGNLVKSPLVSVNIDLEQKVVQQDFVDLYMKSMQQFTESLAKMKLPLDVEKEGTNSGNSENSGSNEKIQTPNGTPNRVFYGSRAFF